MFSAPLLFVATFKLSVIFTFSLNDASPNTFKLVAVNKLFTSKFLWNNTSLLIYKFSDSTLPLINISPNTFIPFLKVK